MNEHKQKSMPSPPEDSLAPERIAGAQERWTECPLRDCKDDPDVLYSDFYLRDRRTNRLMCNACTVRTDAGYMAREVVHAHDNRFYTGNLATDSLIFAVMLIGSVGVNLVAMHIDYYYGFIIGGAMGAGLALFARQVAGKKVTRQSQYIGTAGILLGAALAPTALNIVYGIFTINIPGILNINLLACTLGMLLAAWGIFLRRITFRF